MAKKSRINLSIIDRELSIDGNIVSSGKLIIKGSLRGKIDGDTVIIAEEGRVQSEATVRSMTIGGVFEGELAATQEVILLSTGRCSGRIDCKDLVVENGGVLNAEVVCRKEEQTGDLSDSRNISKLVAKT